MVERRNLRVGRSFLWPLDLSSSCGCMDMEETMIRKNLYNLQRMMAMLAALAIFAMPVAVFSQTKISYHGNKYKPTDDVKVGRQAAAEVEQKLPILNDSQTTNYVSRVGMR